MQREEGDKLYYHDRECKSVALAHMHWASHILHERDVVPYHEIAMIGVYMFGVGQVDKHFWGKDETANYWALPGDYPSPAVLQPSSTHEYEMLAGLPYELREWKDKRGAELWPEEDEEDEEAMEE